MAPTPPIIPVSPPVASIVRIVKQTFDRVINMAKDMYSDMLYPPTNTLVIALPKTGVDTDVWDMTTAHRASQTQR